MESIRRGYLDRWLKTHASPNINGCVLDIGGKKRNKRGTFDPESIATDKWIYLNTDASTQPDILGDASAIPEQNDSYNTVLLCEVLEHLEFPEQVLAEAHRVLKKDGCCIITVPFLMPIHADPYDFARFTPAKLEKMLHQQGFSVERLDTMGGLFAVISDMLRFAYVNKKREFTGKSKLALKILFKLSRKLHHFDHLSPCASSVITTGYGIIARKKTA